MEIPKKSLILVMDDEDEYGELLSSFLNEHGYDVIAAADGLEGEKLFDEHQPDLVILDIVMPRQEGIQTLKSLRAKNKDLPIIAVSGAKYADTYLSVSEMLGAASVFEKPFDLEGLIERVKSLLKAAGSSA